MKRSRKEPTYTLDLGKEEDYLLPGNPGKVFMVNYLDGQVPGYKVFSHRICQGSNLYKIHQFLYDGKEQKLPNDIEDVESVDLFVPMNMQLKPVVQILMYKNYNGKIVPMFVDFVVEDNNEWKIYICEKQANINVHFKNIFDSLDMPFEPLISRLSRSKFCEIEPENFPRKHKRKFHLPKSRGSIFSRLFKWKTGWKHRDNASVSE